MLLPLFPLPACVLNAPQRTQSARKSIRLPHHPPLPQLAERFDFRRPVHRSSINMRHTALAIHNLVWCELYGAIASTQLAVATRAVVPL